jgi:hypothetical protein
MREQVAMASERKALFRRDVLFPHVANFPLPSRANAFRPKLANWAELITSGKADQRTESELLPLFFADFFSQLLGYTGPADGQSRYTMTMQRTIDDDGGRPDGVLGDFNGQPRPVVSVEGKGTKDPLDRLHETVRDRILADLSTGPVTLNQKLTAWWDLDLGSFRAEVKKALKTSIPVAERSEWERALADWQRQHTALTGSLIACEQQINDRVYRLFCLSPSDIRFLDDHARHAMIDYPYGQP